MPEFFQLSPSERLDALNLAADASGRPPHLLEKDVWVVWALQHLFASPHAQHLVFKGGTSLSKAYDVIQRFSEDVDLTYDIRALAADLVGDAATPLPATRSQEKKWSKEIRARLADWISNEVVPGLRRDLDQSNIPATVRSDNDKIFIEYVPLSTGTGYVAPAVLLEFGARSTGEPSAPRPVRCEAARYLQEVAFPTATPQVMRAERTFWEKATAIHVFCAHGQFRGGERFARHWHDIVRLDSAGFVDAALADKALAVAVADYKSIFFAEKDEHGEVIDYRAAVNGALRIVPAGGALDKLRIDYLRMIDDGLLFADAEPFEVLMERCGAIEQKANARMAS